MANVILFIACCFVGLCTAEETKNVHDKMYMMLEATTPCVLRLNGSQSFGCTSSRNGNVGVIHLVHNSTDFDWVLGSPPMDSYILALNLDMFSFENLKKLNDSDRISGVLLMQKMPRKDIVKFSPEDTCPNRYSGLAGPPKRKNTCEPVPWNPKTIYSSISMYKWKMPIFFTKDNATITKVEECYSRFNVPLETQLERSLCALKMSAHMFGSVDSTTCIRRSNMAYSINPIRFCDPLGDDNVWAPVVPFSRTPEPNRKYIIVAARLDSNSLFYGLTPGALSTATSLVTLLSTAHLLFQLTSSSPTIKQNVLFILFNGEAYDYIGSSRVVYDMNLGQFPFPEHPIRLENISLFVELSQLRNDKSVMYHTLKSPATSNFLTDFTSKAATFGITINDASSNSHFPPASFQSFLAKNENISGFVFGSYGSQFTNRFYHSLYDDAANVNYTYTDNSTIADDSLQAFVANFSTALARSLYRQMTEKEADGSSVADRRLVDEMLHCYVDSTDCKFANDSDYSVDLRHYPQLDYYVGVRRSLSQVTLLTRHALVHLLGRSVNASKDECTNRVNPSQYTHSYWSDVGNRCLESAMNATDAVSPAFIQADYDLAAGVYSSWTESVWQNIDVRIFVQPSPGYERLVFVVGNVVLVTSFVAIYWIKRNSRELFNYPHLMTASNI